MAHREHFDHLWASGRPNFKFRPPSGPTFFFITLGFGNENFPSYPPPDGQKFKTVQNRKKTVPMRGGSTSPPPPPPLGVMGERYRGPTKNRPKNFNFFSIIFLSIPKFGSTIIFTVSPRQVCSACACGALTQDAGKCGLSGGQKGPKNTHFGPVSRPRGEIKANLPNKV